MEGFQGGRVPALISEMLYTGDFDSVSELVVYLGIAFGKGRPYLRLAASHPLPPDESESEAVTAQVRSSARARKTIDQLLSIRGLTVPIAYGDSVEVEISSVINFRELASLIFYMKDRQRASNFCVQRISMSAESRKTHKALE